MKKNINQENTFKNKGFYIALALCLAAIGLAVFMGVSSALEEINNNQALDMAQDEQQNDYSDIKEEINDIIEDVNNNQDNVAIDYEPDNSEDDATVNDADVAVEPEPTSEAEVAPEPEPDTEVSAPVEETPVVAPVSPQVFMMPLEGDIINAFSNSEMVKSKTLNEWRTHDGVDIKSAANTPIKATSDGKIEEIIEDPMWGVCITVSHENSYQSLYMGVKANVPVKVGQEVKIGDVIAYVGNTAEIEIAEESHLHFAIKKDGNWIDPMSLMP